jgi:hypothetical protein
MVQQSSQKVLEVGRQPHTQKLVNLPKGWCDGIGVGKGTKVQVLASRVLVIAPPNAGQEAALVLRLMREGTL